VRFVIECSPFDNHHADKLAADRAGRANAVDGLPTWVRWIIVAAVGLSPILTYWFAGVLGRFLRRKVRRRGQRDDAVGTDPSGPTDRPN
jgi:hypothetical protein